MRDQDAIDCCDNTGVADWSPPVSDTLDINTIHVYIYISYIYYVPWYHGTIIHIFNKHDGLIFYARVRHTSKERKKERKKE